MKASRLIIAVSIVAMLGVGSAWAGDRAYKGPKKSTHHGVYLGHRQFYQGPRPSYHRPFNQGSRQHFGRYQAYRSPYHHTYRPRHHHGGGLLRPHDIRRPPQHTLRYRHAPSGAYGFTTSLHDSGYSVHFGFTERW